ncbi:MAG: gliding motility-associated C-terminal domain-containing protein [Flavobacteriales bacterium]|nr:gliding motility-associated C-terminal domain-containing protein [Flavobacteriales bacterium]
MNVAINTAPNAGADASTSICDQGLATNLLPLLVGAQAGGTWTAPGGGAFSGSYDPATNASGNYTYTVAGTLPCAADQAVVTVTETSSPNAGTNGTLTLCANSASTNLFLSLGGGAQAGGTWATPGGAAHSATIDPAVDAAGIYVYTLNAVLPCVSDQSQVNVVINTAPNAGADASTSICDQGLATNLLPLLVGAQAGGTWTAPGGGAFSGSYDPATNASGNYTYTVAGTLPCAADQAVVTVTETSSPNAGTNGTLTLCANSASTNLFLSLGGGAQAGGTWATPGGAAHSATIDPAVDPAGIYVYTLNAVLPCVSDQSQVNVVINAAPNAGADASTSICDQGLATNLLPLLVGAQAGGTWTGPGGGAFSGSYDPATNASGNYTYTVAGTLPCAADQAVVAVTETSSPNAGTNGTLTLCANSAPIDLFAQLNGGAQLGGSWTDPSNSPHPANFNPAVDPAGSYTYTIAGNSPCSSSSAQVEVTVETAPVPGINGSTSVCSGDAAFDLFLLLDGSPDANGTWTSPGGGVSTGVFDPSSSIQGVYTYIVSGIACGAEQATVTVGVSVGPNAGQNNSIVLCETQAPFALISSITGSPDAGGTWTAPGGGVFSGTLDPANAQPGNYTYTVSSSSSCPDAQAEVTVSISASVSAGLVGDLSLCNTSGPVQLFGSLGGTPDIGGTWTAPGGGAFDGSFDPSVDAAGVYLYIVQAVDPCPASSAAVTVVVQTAPNAGENASSALCSDAANLDLFGVLNGAPQPGGSWTGPDDQPSTGIFDPASSLVGAYSYEVTGLFPCLADAAIVVMSVSQAPDAGGDAAITLCSNEDPFTLQSLLTGTPDTDGAWAFPDGTMFNGIVDPASSPSGAYTYTVLSPAPCLSDQAIVNVVINQLPAPVIVVETDGGCAPVSATFTNGYAGFGSCYWTFGNDSASSECAPPTVIYENAGSYSITLTMDAGNGCAASVSLVNGVQVFTQPVASFTVLPENLNTGAPEAFFQNNSTGALAYLWEFGDLGSSTEPQPSFTFPDQLEGSYPVCLSAFVSENCMDTICTDVFVPAGAGLFVPNAFTPDGDGMNDVFTPYVAGISADSYQLLIFDRWGQSLFSTTRIGDGWNGTFGDGSLTPEGVYVWRIIGNNRFGVGRVDRTGHVTLLR